MLVNEPQTDYHPKQASISLSKVGEKSKSILISDLVVNAASSDDESDNGVVLPSSTLAAISPWCYPLRGVRCEDLIAMAYLRAAHLSVGEDENLFAYQLDHLDVDDDRYVVGDHFDDEMMDEYLS